MKASSRVFFTSTLSGQDLNVTECWRLQDTKGFPNNPSLSTSAPFRVRRDSSLDVQRSDKLFFLQKSATDDLEDQGEVETFNRCGFLPSLPVYDSPERFHGCRTRQGVATRTFNLPSDPGSDKEELQYGWGSPLAYPSYPSSDEECTCCWSV